MTTTFAKLRDDSWGIRVEGPKPIPGAALFVKKANGTSVSAIVKAVVWSGLDAKTGKNVALCTIEGNGGGKTPAPAAAPVRRDWKPCGYPGCSPSYCDECDGEGYRGWGR